MVVEFIIIVLQKGFTSLVKKFFTQKPAPFDGKMHKRFLFHINLIREFLFSQQKPDDHMRLGKLRISNF